MSHDEKALLFFKGFKVFDVVSFTGVYILENTPGGGGINMA